MAADHPGVWRGPHLCARTHMHMGGPLVAVAGVHGNTD